MTMESKDIMNLVVTTSTGMLSVILAILAVLPIVMQMVSERVKGFFEASSYRSRVVWIVRLLIGAAMVLLFVLLLTFVSLPFSCLYALSGWIGIAGVVLTVCGLGVAVALAAKIVRSSISS